MPEELKEIMWRLNVQIGFSRYEETY